MVLYFTAFIILAVLHKGVLLMFYNNMAQFLASMKLRLYFLTQAQAVRGVYKVWSAKCTYLIKIQVLNNEERYTDGRLSEQRVPYP